MCITFALLWLSGNASVSRGPPRFAWLDRIIKVTVCTFPYFLLVSTTTTTTTATTAATINENEKDFFWPEMRACVWASIIYSAWFFYVVVDHSACTFYVYIYISVYVYVYKIIFDYIPMYIKYLDHPSASTYHYAHDQLHRSLRWLFGLVGRPLFTSACLFTISIYLFPSFSISFSLSFSFSLSVRLSFSFLYFFRRNGTKMPNA